MGRSTLTRRELEVVRGTAVGKTSAEIAKEMFLSIETVKSHKRHVIAKLQARNMTHAVAIVAMNAPEALRNDEGRP